ncbi:MAG: hypothetical protein FWG88_07250 [Oscillospiraceae bacterium]|nr:hypothetical protein [Oscillospiraceae bacterium]
MRRNDFYIKLITAVLFLAVVCYIGIYVYNAAMKSYETTEAIHFTIERTFRSQGFILRTETVLQQSDNVVLPIVSDGEKVASGQAIAVEYTGREALETASEIRALRLMISQIETSGNADAAEAIRLQSVMELSKALGLGDFRRLDELILNVETSIFASYATSHDDLPAMKTRLESLETRATGVSMVYAPFSGTFTQTVDGYEHLTPDVVFDILPTALNNLFSTPSTVSGYGKLISEFKWYYAAIMNADDARHLTEGRRATVLLSGAFNDSISMNVEQIGRREEDICVVLFSSSQSIHNVAPLRELRADILFDVISGIRIPKEAIHLDDDGRTTFIYLQTGVLAERVDVEILMETGDSYIVPDGARTGSPLRVGSTIIVKANDLYDGKVVR